MIHISRNSSTNLSVFFHEEHILYLTQELPKVLIQCVYYSYIINTQWTSRAYSVVILSTQCNESWSATERSNQGMQRVFFFPFGGVPNKWCRVENWKFLCFSWGLLGGRVDNLMEEFYFSFLSISFRPIRLASDAIFTALGRQRVSKLVATFCILSLFLGHSICFCSSKVVTSFSFNFQ